MEWKKDKPNESGWYMYKGSLRPEGEEGARTCENPCKVALYSGDDPLLVMYGDSNLYDYDKVDGIWSGPEEPAELSPAKEMPFDD